MHDSKCRGKELYKSKTVYTVGNLLAMFLFSVHWNKNCGEFMCTLIRIWPEHNLSKPRNDFVFYLQYKALYYELAWSRIGAIWLILYESRQPIWIILYELMKPKQLTWSSVKYTPRWLLILLKRSPNKKGQWQKLQLITILAWNCIYSFKHGASAYYVSSVLVPEMAYG